jgi:hypothetical protein
METSMNVIRGCLCVNVAFCFLFLRNAAICDLQTDATRASLFSFLLDKHIAIFFLKKKIIVGN